MPPDVAELNEDNWVKYYQIFTPESERSAMTYSVYRTLAANYEDGGGAQDSRTTSLGLTTVSKGGAPLSITS